MGTAGLFAMDRLEIAKNLDNLSIAKRYTSTKLHKLGTMINEDTTDYGWTTGGVETLVIRG
jgi:hypothetical protein